MPSHLHETESRPQHFREIYPEDIPYNPTTHPLEFVEYCRGKLVEIGEGLPTPQQEAALYRDIDLMVFCGIDGSDIQRGGTFGDRRETWAVTGQDFQRMAKDAARADEWATHSTVGYATQHSEAGLPAMAVFDGSKMERIINGHEPDSPRHEDEFRVIDGYTMDDAAIAVFYLPN